MSTRHRIATLEGMTTNHITAGAAGTWQLGDKRINRIGFGAMRLIGNLSTPIAPDRENAIAVLRRAIELGVNHIDTAAIYFTPTRSANELIATALQPYADDLLIATKVGPTPRSRDGAWESDPRPEHLRHQVEENVRQLGLDHLDLVNLRWGVGRERGTGSIADHFGALLDLREAGLVEHVGLSNIGPEQLTEALAIGPVACVQNQYGLTTRREDDALLRLCGEHGVAFVPFNSIGAAVAGAVPGTAPDETGREVVEAIAAAHSAAPSQVRLAWTLHQGPHVLAIPGTADLAHLEENIAAGALRLTDEEVSRLDAVAA